MIGMAILAAALAGEPLPPTTPYELGAIQGAQWIRRPTGADMVRTYPYRAGQQGIGGVVNLTCVANVAGRLKDCVVALEKPAGMGFGAAGLKLAEKFQLSPIINGKSVAGGHVHIPITYSIGGVKQQLTTPTYKVRLPTAGEGHGEVACRVTEGRFGSCAVQQISAPELSDFALEAVAQMAADPTVPEGTRILIPLDFLPAKSSPLPK